MIIVFQKTSASTIDRMSIPPWVLENVPIARIRGIRDSFDFFRVRLSLSMR